MESREKEVAEVPARQRKQQEQRRLQKEREKRVRVEKALSGGEGCT